MSQREFLRRHPGFFLLSAADPSELSTMFQTLITARDEQRASRSHGGRRSFEVRWIHKSDDAEGDPGLVTVGRASSCDITFRHPSVSKVHACFKVGDKNKLAVSDLGSRNGTSVNGEVLKPEKSRLLQTRDRVQFGSVSSMVLDASGLHEFLSLQL
jgi:hypothetical protein